MSFTIFVVHVFSSFTIVVGSRCEIKTYKIFFTFKNVPGHNKKLSENSDTDELNTN